MVSGVEGLTKPIDWSTGFVTEHWKFFPAEAIMKINTMDTGHTVKILISDDEKMAHSNQLLRHFFDGSCFPQSSQV